MICQKEKDCDHFDITLTTQNNIEPRYGQIKNQIFERININKHKVALSSICYSSNYYIKLFSLDIVKINQTRFKDPQDIFDFENNLINDLEKNQNLDICVEKLKKLIDLTDKNTFFKISLIQRLKKYASQLRNSSNSQTISELEREINKIHSSYLESQGEHTFLNHYECVIKDRSTMEELTFQLNNLFGSDVEITVKNKIIELDFSKPLHDGDDWSSLSINSSYLNNENFKSKNLKLVFIFEKTSAWNFVSNFYIYADCIRDTRLNRSLLHIVKTESDTYGYVEKSFEHLKYVECDKTNINSLEISILDKHKNIITFDKKFEIICNLKFKRIK